MVLSPQRQAALAQEILIVEQQFFQAGTRDADQFQFDFLEAISKKGFWLKIAAGPSFKPQEYISISRI